MKVIIYTNEIGGVSVIYPTESALSEHSIDEVAKKDVPSGKPYKIIDVTELPSREDRTSWIVDEADLTDGVGSESNEFN